MITVILIHFGGVLASFIRSSIMAVAGERIVARLRNNLYSQILKQEIAFFDDHKTGELVSRLSSDTTLIQNATAQGVPEVLLGIVKLIAATALMFWLSPPLAGVTLGVYRNNIKMPWEGLKRIRQKPWAACVPSNPLRPKIANATAIPAKLASPTTFLIGIQARIHSPPTVLVSARVLPRLGSSRPSSVSVLDPCTLVCGTASSW
jgi:ABC-type multidrug transport system fused ATPase/permease subunit